MVIQPGIIAIQIQSPIEIHMRTVTHVPALKVCADDKLSVLNVYTTTTEIPCHSLHSRLIQ